MIGNRRSKYKFSDEQMWFNHDIRVWICGAEVTDHLRGSLSLRRGDRNGAPPGRPVPCSERLPSGRWSSGRQR